jgi:hypothetical protein
MGKDEKTVLWPDGTVTDPPPFVPYEPTPDWTRTTRASAAEPQPEPIAFEVAEAEVPENVTRLDTFVRRRDDESGGSGAA